MLPIFATLPYLKLYTFGIFLAVAMVWSTFFLWRNIRLTSYKEELIFDGLFSALFTGILVGRFVHVGLNFELFGFDVIKFLLIHAFPGISLWGFLFGGIFSLLLYFLRNKIKLSTIDYFASPTLLALAIGKLGAFFAGIEPGTIAKIPVAIRYAGFEGARHLTPLYMSLLFFLGAFLAHRLLIAERRGSLELGTATWFSLLFMSIVSLAFTPIVEFNMTAYIYIATATLLTSLVVLLYYYLATLISSFLSIFSFKRKNATVQNSNQIDVESESKPRRARKSKKRTSNTDSEAESSGSVF